jgi:hypothetical protein
MTQLQLALNDFYEIGNGYALTGIIGRDRKNPHHIVEATIKGEIARALSSTGTREFTSKTEFSYWLVPGTSGSPTFQSEGQHLAGMVRMSETDGVIREAYIIPAQRILPHLEVAKAKTQITINVSKRPREFDAKPNMKSFGEFNGLRPEPFEQP